MAINFTQHSILPSNPPEDNPISTLDGDFFAEENPATAFSDLSTTDDYMGNGGDLESSTRDIVEQLPTDPFGMDISDTFTAITGWFEDLQEEYRLYYEDGYQYGFLDNLTYFLDKSIFFHRDDAVYEDPTSSSSSSAASEPFHSGLLFALPYLGLRDLLMVSTVCKDLHSSIHSDPFFWRTILIDFPMNAKLTDDNLFSITNKAQGNLDSLCLIECPMITDTGLVRVLINNPKLTKLSVPGCTRLSVETIVNVVRAMNTTVGVRGVRTLRVGGLHGITEKHLKELMELLGTSFELLHEQRCMNPLLYQRGNFYLSCDDDDRAIDIEVCPRCRNIRLVYDCPSEGCSLKRGTPDMCRACTLCISRCVRCGRCIHDDDYEETFCLEFICSTCWREVMEMEQQPINGSTVPSSF